MDKSVIFEKVQSFVANYYKLDLIEVTVNTKINQDVKTVDKPPIPANIPIPFLGDVLGAISIYASGMSYLNSSHSLDKFEIIMGLEEEFNIEIHDEEVDKIVTVQEVVDCIFQKLNV
ncbi:hypothetical protein [Microcoleus sp. N9_A1]|uniref:hypothetical protein n=1 Tax=Microcoleus sp. N9_A1 TaxID=3055380 RepID=UPI002FCFCDA9